MADSVICSPSASASPQVRTLEAIENYWRTADYIAEDEARAEIWRRTQRTALGRIDELNALLVRLASLTDDPTVDRALTLAMRIGQLHERSRWTLGTRRRLLLAHDTATGADKGRQRSRERKEEFRGRVRAILEKHPGWTDGDIALQTLKDDNEITDTTPAEEQKRLMIARTRRICRARKELFQPG